MTGGFMCPIRKIYERGGYNTIGQSGINTYLPILCIEDVYNKITTIKQILNKPEFNYPFSENSEISSVFSSA